MLQHLRVSRTTLAWIANLCSAVILMYTVGVWINAANANRLAQPMATATSPDLSRTEDRRQLLGVEDLASGRINRGRVFLDTRTRQAFAAGHLLGALNIPAHELMTRAREEIATDSEIVVFCGYKARCEQNFAAIGVMTPCTGVARTLSDELAFKRVRVLAVEDKELLAKGFDFESFSYVSRNSVLNGYIQ